MNSAEKNKKIDDFINSQIKQYLFEDEVGDNLADELAFFSDEEKRARTAINTSNRLKGGQINADERAIKEKQIKANKDRLAKLKKMQDAIKSQQVLKAKQDQLASTTQNTDNQNGTGQVTGQITGQISTGVAENMSMPIMKRSFAEQAPPVHAPVSQVPPAPKPKRTVRVVFDKSSGNPFNVDFSERGFSINGTRLSFETIESALSKEFNITLNQGQGLVLDQVKMQKIIKYKDRF